MSKYPMVGCSQCGTRFAGGNEGYSLCRNHQHRRGLTDREIDAMTAHAAAIKAANNAVSEAVRPVPALNYDPTDPDRMRLPAGTTCGHCAHIRRCSSIYGHTEADTYCDWSPSRFRAPAPACIDTPEQGEHHG